MGDRNNPIKFGPEWLRNLSRERSAASSTPNGVTLNNSNNQNAMNTAPGTSSAIPGPSGGGTTPTNPMPGSTVNNANVPSKILLAKLRYGREEMLALYDRNSEAPPELKTIDMLYQPRGKPPSALNSTFEEERESLRNVAPIGSLSLGERFILGRGVGRGLGTVEGRGRGRGLFIRQPTGRSPSWHTGNPRMPGYSGGTDEDSTPPVRSWNNNTTPNSNSNRSTTDQLDWQPTKMFRNKRPGSNTNWRQSTRDDGDEWRSDLGRSRPQDKWDRDWGERAAQDKQPSWNSNRRTWVGDTNNDDNLPEWALDGSEACGGTFDSSGAFHGYSNDDSNLPKNQDSSYPLTRSHTHGSCVRQKTAEEGSDEWWASEKAKKLSPKRFDAGDIKFKKALSVGISETGNNSSTSTNKSSGNKEENLQENNQKDLDSNTSPNSPQPFASGQDNKNSTKSKFTESKTFDALMRSDINLEEASDERGNFQSVMITPNNSLRQKHQNIVSPVNEMPPKHNRKPGILRLPRSSSNPSAEASLEKQNKTPEDKIVEDIFDMALEDKEMLPQLPISTNDPLLSASNASSTALAQGLSSISQNRPHLSNPMQMGLGNSMLSNQSLGLNQNMNPNIPTQGMPTSQPVGITNSALNASLGLPILGGGNMGIPLQGVPTSVLPSPGIATPGMNTPGLGTQGMGAAGMCAGGMGAAGMVTGGMGGPVMGTPGLGTSALQAGMSAVGMQGSSTGMPGFPSGLTGMSAPNVGNNSLFLGQNSGNSALQSSNEIQMPNHSGQSNMFPIHGLQHSGSQGAFSGSIYSNMMQQNPRQAPPNAHNLADQWYYEDPKKIIQGPFSSKDMYNWYRAGFFSPSLMVRRVCDAVMRPLGSYGPIVPFASPLDMMTYQIANAQHDNMMNSQQTIGIDVMNMQNMNLTDSGPTVDSIQFGSVGLMRNPPYGQAPMVDSLWGQPSTSTELMWIQQALNSRNENRVNNLPMFFWDPQPSAIASNSLLPEEIAKEMKTEDQILAQLRASQNMESQQALPFITDQSVTMPNTTKSDDNYAPSVSATPNLEELQKLIQEDALLSPSSPVLANEKDTEEQPKTDSPKLSKPEQSTAENESQLAPVKSVENKTSKQVKSDNEKTTKSKESTTKSKSKKSKEEKKEEAVESKNKEKEKEKEKEEKEKEKEKDKEREKGNEREKDNDKKDNVKNKEKEKEEDRKVELKRSAEPSPSKSRKEEKPNKKDLEKEKKEWIKEGFTLVKGSEKTGSKENKKKAEETKVAEEAERKRKQEEKQAADEEKKKKQADTVQKQQELQMQQQRQAIESAIKKAPWSAVANQAVQAMNQDGLTLGEIQRLEREKKVEQIKEQQQMMQIIAQQQAAALAREQEMQAGLGWAKKKNLPVPTPGQSLAEIQAEARKQAMAAAAAATAAAAAATVAQALDEGRAPPPLSINNIPWGTSHNGGGGGGFWDTLPNQPIKPEKTPESPKITEPNKPKKKPQPVVTIPVKKEVTPAADFENWCTIMLTPWSSKIDVPTFIGFLKDIESPYEVKDYAKCYLGDTKESSDFARQFLERRSKLLRVGMVTPSDDLCSPAMAVNPRTTSGSDYQEVKGKGKKIKKNKMLKVDSRILGFSVTASEDRINVGDIDTA